MPARFRQRKPCCHRQAIIAFRFLASLRPIAPDTASAHPARMRDEQRVIDVAVVGGGAAGYGAALTAARAGLRTALFAPPTTPAPGRTAALLGSSVDVLSELGVWPALVERAAPLRAIRIIDATRRLIRAPEIMFLASEIGLPAFGYNVPNADLVAGLRRHSETVPSLATFQEPANAIVHHGDNVSLNTNGGLFSARLVIAADGARSTAREAAGIRTRNWSYEQAALVATFCIQAPHEGVSTEFHTETGPFTLVPLPGNRVSLVWVDTPKRARASAALAGTELARLVEDNARSIHGAMELDSPPAVFPLAAALADRLAGRRTILVGEAAHLFPPIGAQGLNLGLRDVAALSRIFGRFRADPGEPAALAEYDAARRADVRTRTLAVDLLNRSLLTDFLPVQAARGVGLAMAASIPALRRALMRQGLARAPGTSI
jgi:2-octaprenyl-6-methoxyphenol hydroxylase